MVGKAEGGRRLLQKLRRKAVLNPGGEVVLECGDASGREEVPCSLRPSAGAPAADAIVATAESGVFTAASEI